MCHGQEIILVVHMMCHGSHCVSSFTSAMVHITLVVDVFVRGHINLRIHISVVNDRSFVVIHILDSCEGQEASV